VTLGGTDATAGFELERLTTSPPVGAALVSVAVPDEEAPPVTLAGERPIAARLAGGGTGVTVSVAVRVAPPPVPVIVTDVDADTAVVEIANVAVVAPAATVTLAGRDATAPLEVERLTTRPLLPAAPERVTVPVALVPPTTLVGLSAIDDSAGAEDAVCAVKRRMVENGPAVPAEFSARTRQNNRCAGKPVTVACDTLTFCVKVSGVVNLSELSIWMM
jgi:hypothetical protein